MDTSATSHASSPEMEDLSFWSGLHRMNPDELRRISSFLNTVADWLDNQQRQEDPHGISSLEYRMPRLAEIARRFHAAREVRRNFVSQKFLGEPAWDILLDLFYRQSRDQRVSITDTQHAANAPLTTVLRYLKSMEDEGLVRRLCPANDKRTRHVELTEKGRQAMIGYLSMMDEFDRHRDVQSSGKSVLMDLEGGGESRSAFKFSE